VREETLQVVAKLGEKGRPLIQKFLRDSAAEVRSKACLIFAKTARDQAVKPLVDIILSEDFLKRDYNEKASFFRALGETGSKEAIPVLKKIANKRMWFKRATWSEMKLCASNTLRIMGA
jgi:HEAT repeat protein